MAVISSAAAASIAVERGATLLQLRIPHASGGALEVEARALVAAATVPVLVNSRADVALAAGAAGVHLPEADIPVAAARRLLASGWVGRSVHSLAAARDAEAEGADYLIFGPVFATESHPGRSPMGLAALAEVCAAVGIPVLAIGGVRGECADQCRAAGAAGYASISAFSPK
jgi:thiamine-phosphate diphosphorylase